MDIKSFAIAATTLVLSTGVNAATVTYGYLTSDDTTNYILDTNTGRQYLRFNENRLTYADTLIAVGAGGTYEGWSMATSTIADDFYSAILGTATTPCTGATSQYTTCGYVTGWVDNVFGTSSRTWRDQFFYLSTFATPGVFARDVGLFNIEDTGQLRDTDDAMSFFDADVNVTTTADFVVGYMLYRDVAAVPVPSAVWLFGAGLLGLFGVARRKIRS